MNPQYRLYKYRKSVDEDIWLTTPYQSAILVGFFTDRWYYHKWSVFKVEMRAKASKISKKKIGKSVASEKKKTPNSSAVSMNSVKESRKSHDSDVSKVGGDVSVQDKPKKKHEKYKVGDYLVYPMHGVGQITSLSRQSILGKTKPCYVMEVENNKMTVMVPIENAKRVGIRPIIAKREIRKVINLLKKDEVDTEEDWKIRYQNNMNKIKSGNIYSVAEVCRNLYKRAQDRELSLMERRLYESAYRLISSEIALSKQISFEEAGNMISEVLA